MEIDIDRGDDLKDNKENSFDGHIIGEALLKERYEKKVKPTSHTSKKGGRSNPVSPLPPTSNASSSHSPQPPYGGHVHHNENDSIVSNNMGLLRRPSTPSRRRGSNMAPSQIPKPTGSNRQSVARWVNFS